MMRRPAICVILDDTLVRTTHPTDTAGDHHVMYSTRLFRCLFLVFTLAPLALLTPASAQTDENVVTDDGPVFEFRTYTATPDNLDALLTRFRDHTMRLFEKHGMTNVGYWIPTDSELAENTLVYLLRHESREQADASWEAFLTDPEWQEVAEESNADGPILENIERLFMKATDFSPMP